MSIRLKDALKDFLKEQKLNINDILDAMDEDPEGILESLRKRTWLNEKETRELMERYTARKINLLIFILQTFYLINPSGLYKGLLLEPSADEVVSKGKATKTGLMRIIKELETRITWR